MTTEFAWSAPTARRMPFIVLPLNWVKSRPPNPVGFTLVAFPSTPSQMIFALPVTVVSLASRSKPPPLTSDTEEYMSDPAVSSTYISRSPPSTAESCNAERLLDGKGGAASTRWNVLKPSILIPVEPSASPVVILISRTKPPDLACSSAGRVNLAKYLPALRPLKRYFP